MNVPPSLSKADYAAPFVGFLIGLAFAYLQGWDTPYLVWGLWTSSLLIGYLSLLSHVIGGAIQSSSKQSPFGNLLGALFLMGFFSIHFCGFHAAHAMVLQDFFPIPALPEKVFNDAFMNPLLLLKIATLELLPLFYLFVIAVLASDYKKLLGPIMTSRLTEEASASSDKKAKKQLKSAILGPYKNVIKMHILIFVFAFFSKTGMDSPILFIIVYAVYFFPWGAFLKDKSLLAKKVS